MGIAFLLTYWSLSTYYNICAAYVCVSHQLRCFLLTAMCPHCEACSAMSDPRMSSWVQPNAWPLWNPLTWKCKGHTAVERQHAPILLLDLHHQILPRSNMISNAAFNRLIQILNEGWLAGSRWDFTSLQKSYFIKSFYVFLWQLA